MEQFDKENKVAPDEIASMLHDTWNFFSIYPGCSKRIYGKKFVRAILLDRYIYTFGDNQYEIKAKHICAGVYDLFLVKYISDSKKNDIFFDSNKSHIDSKKYCK